MHYVTFALLTAGVAEAVLGAASPAAWGHTWNGRPRVGWGSEYQTAPIYDGHSFCLTDAQAIAGASIFRQLITAYTEDLALEALAEDFVDWTSAVNIIRNRGNKGPIQVDGISFDGRAAFLAAQGSQPPIPFDTLNTWHSCDSITTRWRTTRSASGQSTEANDIPSVGIAVLVVIPDSENSYGFRIAELYSEFNSAAWLVNLGIFTPTPVDTAD